MVRKFPRQIRKLVIKIGSSVIATYKMKPKTAHLYSLIEQIGQLKKDHRDVVLVSSGAIVLGMGEMNISHRPHDLSTLQALAAVGQTVLMRTYSDLFKKVDIKCAQVLLTWDDFDNRDRYNNARKTLKAILDKGIIPIINENDTIANDEIKFGDNDRLSALVASLIPADLLLILSDVEGFYELRDGQKKLFDEIKEITQEIEGMAKGTTKKHFSKGGMISKLEAVKIAIHANIPCIVAHGETENILPRILSGERIGTFFMEKGDRLLARKHWISFGAKPKGVITVDQGAKEALLKGGRSLLLPGLVAWEGHFNADDVVVVCDQDRKEIARGIINYSYQDLASTDNKKGKTEVIHCDDLVLSKR